MDSNQRLTRQLATVQTWFSPGWAQSSTHQLFLFKSPPLPPGLATLFRKRKTYTACVFFLFFVLNSSNPLWPIQITWPGKVTAAERAAQTSPASVYDVNVSMVTYPLVLLATCVDDVGNLCFYEDSPENFPNSASISWCLGHLHTEAHGRDRHSVLTQGTGHSAWYQWQTKRQTTALSQTMWKCTPDPNCEKHLPMNARLRMPKACSSFTSWTPSTSKYFSTKHSLTHLCAHSHLHAKYRQWWNSVKN